MASISHSAPAGIEPMALLAARGAIPDQGVELRFFPVHDLRRDAVSTFFCAPVFVAAGADAIHGYRAFRDIGPRDLPYLDRAVLQHAIRFAHRLESDAISAAVGAPVNFETLTWAKGREVYIDALRAMDAAHSQTLIVKIDDIPPGTPDSKLAEVVAMLRHYAKRIFIHLSDYDTRLIEGASIGAAGFVTTLPPRATRPTIMAAAKSLARMCEAQRALSCIDNVENEAALEMISAIGVRFATGNVFDDQALRADAVLETLQSVMKRKAQATPALSAIANGGIAQHSA